ncbi:MAG: hypothetical protein QFB87_02515 [Patescibacteria group bacterium]|nr:hypothetical protein [Patescibacteria group bacterium]
MTTSYPENIISITSEAMLPLPELTASAADSSFPEAYKQSKAVRAWQKIVTSSLVTQEFATTPVDHSNSVTAVAMPKSTAPVVFETESAPVVADRPLQIWQQPAADTISFEVRDDVITYQNLNGRRNVTVSLHGDFTPQS